MILKEKESLQCLRSSNFLNVSLVDRLNLEFLELGGNMRGFQKPFLRFRITLNGTGLNIKEY